MKIQTLLGLPILAFALAAPAVYAAESGGNAPKTGSTDSGTVTKGRMEQHGKSTEGMTGAGAQPTANNAVQSGKKTYGDRSGGVGTGAGSSENLGSSNTGGGVNSSGTGSGKP